MGQVRHSELRIGTAGWSLPKQHASLFVEEGSHLERYGSRLNCVEINSSFHRPHMRKTWERWAATTPEGFRFSVKVPKAITHTAKLVDTGGALQTFLGECTGLGEKLGPLLVQLPPKLAYDEGAAQEFFTTLRELHAGTVALEPRHASWFVPGVERMLRGFEVARVAADPPKGSELAAKPGGWAGLRYFRMHGSPRMYYSEYTTAALKRLAKVVKAESSAKTWVIFDNTAMGFGTPNALALAKMCSGSR